MATFEDNVASKLVAYFKKRLGMYEYKNGWLKGDCPECGKEDKFGVNIGRDQTNCFVCNEKMKPLDLIVKLEGFETHKELYKFIHGLKEVDTFQTKVIKLEKKQVNLPEGFRLINRGEGHIATLARNYMKGRGFKINDLAMKGVGYTMQGKYAGCIILPFFLKGELIYFIGRKFTAATAKFTNPEVEEFGIGKSQIIYNQDCLDYYKRVQMVESYINALTLGDRAFAILGKIPSAHQRSTILRSPIQEIDIILDSDAYLESIKIAMEFSLEKVVRLIKMPKDQDVNDLGRKATKLLIKAAKPQSYQELYKLYLFEKDRINYEQATV